MKTAKQHAACLLSFFLPVFIMLGIFIANDVFPFGDKSFMHSDMYHQYVPFLSEMLHKLRSGDGLFYSWNVGIGSNFLALYAYYMASPFNWLALLLPQEYLIEFMSYMVIIKIGLCGFTFSWYLTRHFNTRSLAVVPFAYFYAMSGFIAAYNWNVMWLDCIFLFPLIALGLERLVSENKYKLYCISLALCILSNYYISIMICIFLVCYFCLILVCSRRPVRELAGRIGRFALFSLLAGGMAAILLIPEYAALHLTEFSEFHFPSRLEFYFSVIDMLSRHCVNVAVETGLNHWPNLYCGAAVFLLVPLYLANSRIGLREKITRVGLLAFLLVSFSANVLNFIWHGFNYPDSLPCRQSFLYIFLLLTLCCEAVLRIRECSYKALGIGFCLSLGLVLLFEKLAGDQPAYAVESFLLTAVLLCLYGGFLYLYKKGALGDSGAMARLLAALLFLTVVTEGALNMYTTSCSVTSRSKYLENYESYTALTARIRAQDPDFYRMEKFSRKTKNDGTLAGFPTASLFSSTANGNVENFYEKLGMSHSKVFYSFDGATPLTSALLSVRYMFSESPDEDPDLYTLIGQEGNICLYECKYSLPLGFLVTGSADAVLGTAGWDAGQGGLSAEGEEPSPVDTFLGEQEDPCWNVLELAMASESSNPVERQNRMAYALGLTDSLFAGAATGSNGSTTTIPVEQAGHYYAWVGNTSVDTLQMESQAGHKSFTKLKYHYICDLGWHEEGDVISLYSEDASGLELSAYRLDPRVMDAVIEILGGQTMTVDAFDSTHISGHIQTDQAGELILSVPYEPGWTVWVDGQKTEPGLFDDTFISLYLEEGSHTIEMRYRPAGFTAGILVSLLCLAAFLALILLERKKGDASGQ